MAFTDFTPSHVFEQPAPAFDVGAIESPAYVVDLSLLKRNMEKLNSVQTESGAKVLLALKGFSMFSVFPHMRDYLSGCCASGLHEALLAAEFGKEVHVYAPSFKPDEMRQIIPISHHLSFNSLAQFRKFQPMLEAAKAATGHAPSPGIRVNPEHSEVEVSLYDPCSPGCRLGIRADSLEGQDLSGIEGLHFHALCEQDSDVLERVVAATEKRFPKLLEQVQWVNMGGGHHITRNDYDVERLIRVLRTFRERWGKEVYIEPGEAAGLNTGYLIAEVQDIVGARKSSVVTSPSASKIHHGQDRPRPQLFRPAADARHAAAGLRRSLQTAEGKLDQPDAAQRLNTETESLLDWARENNRLITGEELVGITAGLEELEGASEHDVCVDHSAGRVLKWTKPPNFGARGSAMGYLDNILACNVVFELDWRFEAVIQAADGVRILTSQPFIIGEKASVDDIDAYFSALGFTKERENTYARPDGLKVADARPDNILRRPNGALIAIDVHVLGVSIDDLDVDEYEGDMACTPPVEEVLPTIILDLSITAHMPDTLEMPYRPHIFGAGRPGEFPHEYRIGGMTCLAGDVIEGFSFPEPLQVGQRLVFADMAHYTMVKTTTFNGVPHPDIAIYDPATKEYRVVRRFGYEDFRNKLS